MPGSPESPARPSLPALRQRPTRDTSCCKTIVRSPLGLTITRRRAPGQGQMSRRPGDDRPSRAGRPARTLSRGLRRELGLKGGSRGCPFPITRSVLRHLIPGTGQVTDRLGDHQPGVTGHPAAGSAARDASARAGRRRGWTTATAICPRRSSGTPIAAGPRALIEATLPAYDPMTRPKIAARVWKAAGLAERDAWPPTALCW